LEELNAIGIVDVKFHVHPDWDNKDLGKNLSLLVLHENPDDLVALRYWLGSESNNWLKGEYGKLREYCKESDLGPKEVLENPDLYSSLRIPYLRRRWEELQCELYSIAELDDNALIDRLLPQDGPTKEISEKIRILKKSGETDKSLIDLLTEVIVSVDQEDNNATINIMTIHGAKGLTSHTVVLTSLINGLLPAHFNPTNREERLKLEEERRLVYVGLTRAKNRLIISSFRKIDKTESQRLQLALNGDGQYWSTVSSRFISEFGPKVPPAIEGDTWLTSMH
jgi:DNA helicase II / ATP-dependent DNA helicase PcrA